MPVFEDDDLTVVGAASLWAFFVGMAGAVMLLIWTQFEVYASRTGPGAGTMTYAFLTGIGLAFSLVCFAHAISLVMRFRHRERFTVAPARTALMLHGGLMLFYGVFGWALPMFW